MKNDEHGRNRLRKRINPTVDAGAWHFAQSKRHQPNPDRKGTSKLGNTGQGQGLSHQATARVWICPDRQARLSNPSVWVASPRLLIQENGFIPTLSTVPLLPLTVGRLLFFFPSIRARTSHSSSSTQTCSMPPFNESFLPMTRRSQSPNNSAHVLQASEPRPNKASHNASGNPTQYVLGEGIVKGDEGPVSGVAQVVCHGVKVVGVHGEEGREEDGKVQGEVKRRSGATQRQPHMCMA